MSPPNKRTSIQRLLCVFHRSVEEKARPGYWRWQEATQGLLCELDGCERAADVLGKCRTKRTPETREKMRQAKLGKHHTPEAREKMRQAKLGKHHTPEAREKMRQAMLGVKRGPYRKRRTA